MANYIREREYKEYDSVISIRLNKQFYKFLHKINPKNMSSTIRSLIRVDLHGSTIAVTDKEVKKMFSCFWENDRAKIKQYIYKDRKDKLVTIRLYQFEKQEIIKRSNGNISNYVDLVIMDYINGIEEKYDEYRWS